MDWKIPPESRKQGAIPIRHSCLVLELRLATVKQNPEFPLIRLFSKYVYQACLLKQNCSLGTTEQDFYMSFFIWCPLGLSMGAESW